MSATRYPLDARSLTFFGLAIAMLATIGNVELIWAKFVALGGTLIYVVFGAVTVRPVNPWQEVLANLANKPSVILTALSASLWSVGFATPLSSVPGPEWLWSYVHALIAWLAVMLITEVVGARFGLGPGRLIMESIVTAWQKRFLSALLPVVAITVVGAGLFAKAIGEPRAWQFQVGIFLISLGFLLGLILGRFLNGKLESLPR